MGGDNFDPVVFENENVRVLRRLIRYQRTKEPQHRRKTPRRKAIK